MLCHDNLYALTRSYMESDVNRKKSIDQNSLLLNQLAHGCHVIRHGRQQDIRLTKIWVFWCFANGKPMHGTQDDTTGP
jgi:hypothetical protein